MSIEDKVRTAYLKLQQGNASAAQSELQVIIEQGNSSRQILLLHSMAARQAGDNLSSEASADKALLLNNNDPHALIFKGDAKYEQGDMRAASSFFKSALTVIGKFLTVPEDLQSEAGRIEQLLASIDSNFGTHLDSVFGTESDKPSSRFHQSIELLTGRRQLYLSQPSQYLVPELPNRQFFEREEFEWVPALEAETASIRDEILSAMQQEAADFSPYLSATNDRPVDDHIGLIDNENWSSCYLFRDGAHVEKMTKSCPRSWAAMQNVPLAEITVRAPVVMFSKLAAGAKIAAHHGAMNARLICHLPLVIPKGCALRVGNEIREWEVGKLLIFDDTIEHEAWNNSDEDRIVLIFDIWRPELSRAEQQAVKKLFVAVDEF